MTDRMTKMHYIIDGPNFMQASKTACGKTGWWDSGTEFDTADCHRFEATREAKAVTCKRCVRASSPSMENKT